MNKIKWTDFIPVLIKNISGYLLIVVEDAVGKVLEDKRKNLEWLSNADQLESRKTVQEDDHEANERIDGDLITSTALSLIMGLVKEMIRNAVLDIMGITTTPSPPGPVIAFIEGILGGENTTPTTTSSPR